MPPTLALAAAVRTGAALVRRDAREALELRGADRLRFLNGLMTCDVKALAPGQGCYGFFTDGKGRVLADAAVLALGDRLLLDVPGGLGEALAAHLGRYVIADRVEIARRPELVALTLAGPRAAAVAGAGALAAPWSHEERVVAGVAVVLVREGRLGVDGFTGWVESPSAPALAVALAALPGVGTVSADELDGLRIEAGLGRFGRDFGPEHFPQETGADAVAVSYTKGCYLGQEIVARIHYRGGVQRALRGLRFGGDVPPLGTVVSAADGREAGTVTSAVVSPRFGPIGLAVLHQRVGEAGAEVALATGDRATLAALPFAAAAS